MIQVTVLPLLVVQIGPSANCLSTAEENRRPGMATNYLLKIISPFVRLMTGGGWAIHFIFYVILQGFNEVISTKLLQPFDAQEIEVS